MTNPTPTRVAPAADAPLTEQISSLVSRETRAFLLGTTELDGARSEGAVIRTLLLREIERFRQVDPGGYALRVELGGEEIGKRLAARAAAAERQADRGKR